MKNFRRIGIAFFMIVCIMVQGMDGSESAFTQVQAGVEESGFTLLKTNISLKVGQTYKIQVKSKMDSGFEYQTSDKRVATVSHNGVIKGIGKGTCTVTVTRGAWKKKLQVTVSNVNVTYKGTYETSWQDLKITKETSKGFTFSFEVCTPYAPHNIGEITAYAKKNPDGTATYSEDISDLYPGEKVKFMIRFKKISKGRIKVVDTDPNPYCGMGCYFRGTYRKG